MSRLTQITDPAGRLQALAERDLGPPLVQRLERALGTRPALPLIALAMVGFGLVLLIAITIVAGTLSDQARDAATVRPWFRMTLLTGLGVMLAGIITMLLAITVRIWWLMFANRAFLPVVVDARRRAAGRTPRYPRSAADAKEGAR